MDKDIKEKAEILINRYYPWGGEGFLPSKLKDENIDGKLNSIYQWLEEKTVTFRPAALSLIAKIQPILKEIKDNLPDFEKTRFFARIDQTALVKTPESILEKMVRDWNPEKSNPEVTFDNFIQELDDIGRFRIVANFLSDVTLIKDALENPYGAEFSSLTQVQKDLKAEYYLQKNRLEDVIYLKPDRRNKGERCFKGVFYPRQQEIERYKVEVQIQTQLQEAWDKKDHFLVYEPRRRGEKIDLKDEIEIFAMSELLYVADLTFERLKSGVTASRSENKENQNASTE
jgi:ppGpp synthetase/RelA/SpoT-type nucleotidyltranferase